MYKHTPSEMAAIIVRLRTHYNIKSQPNEIEMLATDWADGFKRFHINLVRSAARAAAYCEDKLPSTAILIKYCEREQEEAERMAQLQRAALPRPEPKPEPETLTLNQQRAKILAAKIKAKTPEEKAACDEQWRLLHANI